MKIRNGYGVLLGLMVGGCGGGSNGADEAAKGKLAGDLVTCKSEVSSLKEELATAKALLAKAQAANPLLQLEELTLKAGKPSGDNAPPEKEGHVNSELVIKVFKQNVGALNACYVSALKRKPDLQYVNQVTARFALKGSGNATNTSFSPRSDREMESCMAAAVGRWKFPQFEGSPVAFEMPVKLVAIGK